MPKPKDIPRELSIPEQISALRRPSTATDDGWIKVGDANDEISPAWQNGWDNSNPGNPVSFFLDKNGIVRLRGEAIGGDDGSVAFTLPEGFRPEFDFTSLGSSYDGTNDALYRIVVKGNGELSITLMVLA